ncbi:DUF2855 family protein [Altererythrobacter sp. RZ02]|uniref:DUF2855 family protein n=1 Tax=Pontixanthobacter rizhaonensis TaxID=2730337 RepID=A0A848QG94_9SPHN|nr:DUF2855 family protein [Pontixanthobacter rizhaonensis]NMW31622.1 DUF2855 family protein [Pontixanthobacter rizhaonensis]
MTLHQVHVRKDELTTAALVEAETGPLAEGAVRLEVESFSVTANNITYAVVGDGFGYWNFFPPKADNADGLGIVPMWGHAKVIESNHGEFAVGERVYGYLPMGSHLDVVPGNVSAASFSDMTDYRQPMSPVYNNYNRLAADPEHDPARENERMIYGPLFKTGFVIDYFLRSEDWFGAGQVILTSASSKTAMGLASVAKQNSPDVKRIGLTSPGNVEFVKSTGLYDEVVAYDDLGSVAAEDSVSVDFAGNAELLSSIHTHFGDALKYSCLVGATHIEERGPGFGGAAQLPGPKPTLFFAPDHFVSFFKAHGPVEGGKMIAKTWHGFLSAVEGTVDIVTLNGLDAARETYLTMLSGKVDPAKGIVIQP